MVDLIEELPDSELARMDLQTGLKIKKQLKVPMILLCVASGLCAGTALGFFKCFGTMVISHQVGYYKLFGSALFICAMLACSTQMFLLNLAIRTYKNIDVMPVY